MFCRGWGRWGWEGAEPWGVDGQHPLGMPRPLIDDADVRSSLFVLLMVRPPRLLLVRVLYEYGRTYEYEYVRVLG